MSCSPTSNLDVLIARREDSAGDEVDKRVVATLPTILDGMGDEKDGGGDAHVVSIGTTNHPNSIDHALRHLGRFDREIDIGVPGAEAPCNLQRAAQYNPAACVGTSAETSAPSCAR